jgi:hypothetical protein
LATSSMDTPWNPERPKARLATDRSWALRSGPRMRRFGLGDLVSVVGLLAATRGYTTDR